MLKFGNKEFRNLQEQVLKNMQNIANIKEGTAVLNEFGIKVVGEVDTLANLPSVVEYKSTHPDWEYGDAFAVGSEAPYDLYILTRANDTILADHWFDIGDFPAPGPQGEQGPQGEIGPQGQTGDTGPAGADAGFGSVLASAQTLPAGSSATATVQVSGPNTAKEFSFTFGIPKGYDGNQVSWGNIQGTLSNQTDLQDALDDKQDELIGSGTGQNIKTVNGNSLVGSGNIEINSGVWGNISGTLADQTDLKNALDAKQDVIDSSHKLPAANVSGLAAVATTGSYTDLINKPNFATVATSGSYNDLVDRPTIGNGTIYVKKNGTLVESFALNQQLDANVDITVPTKVSDLSNDSGFITGVAWGDVTGTLSNQTDLQAALDTKAALAGGTAEAAPQIFTGYNRFNNTVSIGTYQNKLNPPSANASGNICLAVDNSSGPRVLKMDSNGIKLQEPWQVAVWNLSYPAKTGTIAVTDDITVTDVEVNGSSVVTGTTAEITMPTVIFSNTPYQNGNDVKGIKIDNDEYNIVASTVDWADINDKPTFATVATSGSYDDLSDKPTIPAAQVNSDWSAVSGVSEILNKPDLSIYAQSANLATVATSGSYNDLTDKPTIPVVNYPVTDVTVGGSSVLSGTVAAIPALFSGDYNDLSNKPTIPTATSDLTNDSGFITSSALSGYATLAGSSNPYSITNPFTGYHKFTNTISVNDGTNSASYGPLAASVSGTFNITTSNTSDSSWSYGKGVITKKQGGTGITQATINLPTSSGTIALTSDIAVHSVTPTTETWTFTLSDNTTTTKTIVTGITVA